MNGYKKNVVSCHHVIARDEAIQKTPPFWIASDFVLAMTMRRIAVDMTLDLDFRIR